jgi:hypothetical protein
MVIAAGIGFARALRGSAQGRRVSSLLFVYAACLVASGIFAPDPMGGFPQGTAGGQFSLSGILHLAFGAIGFFALAAAALALGSWYRQEGDHRMAVFSRLAAALVAGGFVVGAALATQTEGVLSLWVAVVAGWLWLAIVSIDIYKRVPHPVLSRRDPVPGVGETASHQI